MLKKLKGLFVVEDESKVKAPEEKQGQVAKGTTSNPAPKPAEPINVPRPEGGQPSERFVNKLLGAIEESNLKGFDYLEFKQALQNLDSVAMDESTRYKSAMAMAKTMGTTSDALIDSAQYYINVLGKEEEKFRLAFDSQQTSRVQEREKAQESFTNGIEQRKQKITELQAEIKMLEGKLETLQNDITQASEKVNATKDGFYNAYHIVVDQIKADLDMMKQNA